MGAYGSPELHNSYNENKLKKCKACGHYCFSYASRCSNCGKNFNINFKKFYVVVIILIILIGVYNTSHWNYVYFARHKMVNDVVPLFGFDIVVDSVNEENNLIEGVNKNNDLSSSNSGIKEEKNKAFLIGETIRIGDVTILINNARWATSRHVRLKEGQKLIFIDCTIENLGDESLPISSQLMFNLYDEDYYARNIAHEAIDVLKGSLDLHLDSGRKVRGEIAFYVEEGRSKWELIFNPYILQPTQVVFEIRNEDVKL